MSEWRSRFYVEAKPYGRTTKGRAVAIRPIRLCRTGAPPAEAGGLGEFL